MRGKWFCCAFKLGFLQLTCKASLILKSNLELALSITLKEKELFESKNVGVECIYLVYHWLYPSGSVGCVLDYGVYPWLHPSGSAPSCIYGTPKIQKLSSSDSFPKLRPIISSIGNFNYNLARFFCDLLSPLVPNDYSCKDTFFLNLRMQIFPVSYDITSLFTNIPLQETIDIAINLIFNHNPNLNITKKQFKKLFHFATSETHFVFNCKFIIKLME